MPRKRLLRKSMRQLRSSSAWRTRLVFWGGAVATGLAATLLAYASGWADETFRSGVRLLPWLPLVLTPLGLVFITWGTRRFFPGGEGSGIPQAIAALRMRSPEERDRVLSLRIAAGKAVAIVLGLLCGASIGREGPTVHIAASLMHSLRHAATFPMHQLDRGLVLAGGGAGLAAAFNTPLAGVVFAIEEMSRSFEQRTSGTVLTAVLLAGMTALSIQGNYTYFGTHSVEVQPTQLLASVLICGSVGGLLGGIFSALLVDGVRYLTPWRQRHPYRVAVLCGLAIALIGIASGGTTWGTGYGEARNLLEGSSGQGLMYTPLKLLATVASYWSGIPGGIFAPSLSTGAGVGTALGPLFPAIPAVAVGLLGMVGYFTGVVQTPITAVVIIMEMTDEHELLLPLLATALVAESISRYVCPQALYRAFADDYLKSINTGTATRKRNLPG